MSRKPTAEDFDRLNNSKYLNKSEVGDDEITTGITGVVIEPVRERDGTTKEKYVVSFDAFERPLVINTTNKIFLGEAFGKDATKWVDNSVVVYVDNTVIFNGVRGGIRLRTLPKPPKKSPQRPAAIDADLSDDIPFDR